MKGIGPPSYLYYWPCLLPSSALPITLISLAYYPHQPCSLPSSALLTTSICPAHYLHQPCPLPLSALPTTFVCPAHYLHMPYPLSSSTLPATFICPAHYLHQPFLLPSSALLATFIFPVHYLYQPCSLPSSAFWSVCCNLTGVKIPPVPAPDTYVGLSTVLMNTLNTWFYCLWVRVKYLWCANVSAPTSLHMFRPYLFLSNWTEEGGYYFT